MCVWNVTTECPICILYVHMRMLQYTAELKLIIRTFPLPDGAFRHAWHRQCDIQGDLALPSEDTHHTEGLHLTAGGVDRGTPQICQLAEHNAVLIWNGTARTALWWWFICCKWAMDWESRGKKSRRKERKDKGLDYFMTSITILHFYVDIIVFIRDELTCLLQSRNEVTQTWNSRREDRCICECINQWNSCSKFIEGTSKLKEMARAICYKDKKTQWRKWKDLIMTKNIVWFRNLGVSVILLLMSR